MAYLCEFPTLLGGERSLLTFLDHRDRGRIDPLVVAPESGPLGEALARRRLQRLDWPARGRHAAGLLAGALRERGVQLIHGNSLMVADAAVTLSRALDIPAVVHVRDIMGLSAARLERLASLAALIAVSGAVARWLREEGIPGERITRIHNAVDAEALRRAARPGSLRRELGIPADAPLLGCIGQLARRKGQDLFLELAQRLASRFPGPRFVVAGERYSEKEESVEYEAALGARAAAPPLAGRVHFLGYREDVPSILADLDVLVVPSHQEPLSRVLLEALALAVPAVATDVGGTREIIEDGVSGLVVAPHDAAALAESVTRLLESEELRQRLRANGPPRARDFAPERQVQDLLALYGQVLDR